MADCGRGYARNAHKLFPRYLRRGREAFDESEGGEHGTLIFVIRSRVFLYYRKMSHLDAQLLCNLTHSLTS